MTIGEIIYKNRKKAGISQEELGNMLNVTRQSISLWETDQTVPSTANLVRLTEIFNISMDELCGTTQQPAEEAEKRVAETVEFQQGTIAESSVQYDKPLIKSMYTATFGKTLFAMLAVAVIAAGLLIVIPFTDARNSAAYAAPAFLLVVIAAWFCGMYLGYRRMLKSSVISQPNHKNSVKFFADRFEVESVSDCSNVKYIKSYSDIKKVKYSKDHIFIFYDNVITPIKKSALGENAVIVCGLLHIDTKEATAKGGGSIRRLLLAMFGLSIASLWFALIATIVGFNLSPMPEFSFSMVEYMWIFYTFIPLPLASLILGIVFLKKKYKCKKNIIGGFIMAGLLAIYGSFTPMMAWQVKHDFNFITEIESVLSIELPDSGYVSYRQITLGSVTAEGMAKFDNAEEMLAIAQSGKWVISAKDLQINGLPSYKTDGYDYYYLYDVDCKAVNPAEGKHDGHDYIYLAYRKDGNILHIMCLVTE